MPNDAPIENAVVQKQYVRLFDIFLFAPILIGIGWSGKMNNNIRAILIIMGVGTLIYNGYYFLKYRQ